MQLPLDDVDLFFRLHRGLMFFVNRKLKVLDRKFATPEAYAKATPEDRFKVHQALLEQTDLIDAFADENPFGFDEEGLEVVRSWKDLVYGTFYVFRQLRDYMVFLSTTDPVVAYGVVALFDPFEAVIGPYLPRMVKTTLLPFKGRIVYDGLLTLAQLSPSGPAIKRRLNDEYKDAKQGKPASSHRCRRSPATSGGMSGSGVAPQAKAADGGRRRPGAGPRPLRRRRARRMTGSSP